MMRMKMYFELFQNQIILRNVLRKYITNTTLFINNYCPKPIHFLLKGKKDEIYNGFTPKPNFSIEKIKFRKESMINICLNKEYEIDKDYIWYECKIKPKGFINK